MSGSRLALHGFGNDALTQGCREQRKVGVTRHDLDHFNDGNIHASIRCLAGWV